MNDRRERVVVEVVDGLSGPMVRMAGATALVNHELDSLSGRAVRARGGIGRLNDSGGVPALTRNAEQSGHQIDRLSGRMAIFAQAAALLGPALVPVSALAIPALSGLAAQAGFAALAGGTLIGTFQGVGDALKALSKARLEPTAQNLEAARQAMRAISPDAQAAVLRLRDMVPELKKLRDAGAAGFFPGFIDGLDSLETRIPDVQRIVSAVSGELGAIAADSADSLASDRWDDFFTFLEENAPSALADMARATGNVTHAAAEMWMALDPVNDDFSSWLVDQTRKLDEWATGLDQTQGFEDFVNYIETNGPQVADTFGAIANAALQIVEATAPLGGPVLQGLEAVADIISAIADSNIGTPLFTAAAGVALLSRASSTLGSVSKSSFGLFVKGQADAIRQAPRMRDVGNALIHSMHSQQQLNTYFASGAQRALQARSAVLAYGRSIAPSVAGVATLAAVSSGLTDRMGLTNTATLGLAGSMRGPLGAAVGASIGFMLDAKAATKGYQQAIDGMNKSAEKGDLASLRVNIQSFKKEIDDTHSLTGWSDFFSDMQKGFGGLASQGPAFAFRDDTAQLEQMLKLSTDLDFAFVRLGTSLGTFQTGVSIGGQQISALATRLLPFLNELGITGKQLAGMSAPEIETLAGQLQGLVSHEDSLAGRTDSLVSSLKNLDDQTLTNADSASQLATALTALLGPNLDAEAATDAHTNALRALGKSLRDNKAGFDGNTAGAIANRDASRSWVASLTDMLAKQAAAGSSTRDIARQVQLARTAFINEGVAAGRSAESMRRRARQMGLTPKLVRTVFDAAGLEMVSARVARLNRQYQSLPRRVRTAIQADGVPKTTADIDRLDKKVGGLTKQQRRIVAKLVDQTPAVQATILRNLKKVDKTNPRPKATLWDQISPKIPGIQSKIDSLHGTTITVTTNHKDTHSARGNLFRSVRAFSMGDVANAHQPELAGPGPIRVWREPETMGEAYIPLANDTRRPRARAIAEQTVQILGGNINWYAMGGISRRYAAGGLSFTDGRGSITVNFPAPSVLAASVKAAGDIAASAALTARSAKDIRQANLQDLETQKRIHDLVVDLNRKETVEHKNKKGKVVSRTKRLAVRGIDRTVALAELADARAGLREDRQAVQDAARQAIADARAESTSSLVDSVDIFARGHSVTSAINSVNREIADIATYGQTLASLKAAGASPALLARVKKIADEGGDFRAAIKFGQALLAQPAALGQLNAGLAQLAQVSSGVATITSDPRFSSSAVWDPTGLAASSRSVSVLLGVDPTAQMKEIARVVRHEVSSQLTQAVG